MGCFEKPGQTPKVQSRQHHGPFCHLHVYICIYVHIVYCDVVSAFFLIPSSKLMLNIGPCVSSCNMYQKLRLGSNIGPRVQAT